MGGRRKLKLRETIKIRDTVLAKLGKKVSPAERQRLERLTAIVNGVGSALTGHHVQIPKADRQRAARAARETKL